MERMVLVYCVCVSLCCIAVSGYIQVRYAWNKSAISAEYYLAGYGPEVCGVDPSHFAQDDENTTYCCHSMSNFPCICKAPCQNYGVCCSDRVPGRMIQAWPETGCLEDRTCAMVRCPQSWGEGDIREACETGQGKYTVDEPVNDLDTGVTYRNEFCAQCHVVEHYTSWEFKVTCYHFQYVFKARSGEEFLDLAMQDGSECRIKIVPPEGIKSTFCPDQSWFFAVSACNVTGGWATEDYDADVENNCLRYKSLVLRVKYSLITYQNLFCAICNGVFPIRHIIQYVSETITAHIDIAVFGHPPLSLLLGLGTPAADSDADQNGPCPIGQYRDISNECRNLTCIPGKVIVNNTCSTAVTQIRGLMYNLNITLLPTSEVVIPFPVIAGYKLQEIFEEKLRPAAARYNLNIKIATEMTQNWTKPVVLFGVHISGDLTALRDITRDNAEQTFVQNIFSLIEFEFDGKNVSLRQASVVDELLVAAMDHPAVYTNNLPLQRYDFEDQISATIPPEFHIPLSPILLCPYLEFQPPEFEVRQPGNGANVTHVVLKFGEEEVTLADLEKAEIEGDTLRVCLETLESLPRKKTTTVEGLSWQYILSMVIIPLSIICLVLTLIVFSVLPVLRTEPGMNTMGTCCALLVAQVTLLLASHRVTFGVGCVALGVVVHLSWLSMFCWTSVCSLHMFHVFSAKTYRGSRSGQYWRLLRNVLLTLLLPAVVVGVVVGVCYQTSSGATIGYSSLTCYLDSALLVGVAMVLPVSLMLVLNLALFILTARRIYMVTKLQPRAETEGDSRQHLHVCARLSVLTGATWMLSLIAEGLGIDWLQALAILANGGQGVMLFLSYVTTRRVATMLSVRLGLREKEVSSGKTQSTNDRYSPGRSKNNTENAGNSIEMPLKTLRT